MYWLNDACCLAAFSCFAPFISFSFPVCGDFSTYPCFSMHSCSFNLNACFHMFRFLLHVNFDGFHLARPFSSTRNVADQPTFYLLPRYESPFAPGGTPLPNWRIDLNSFCHLFFHLKFTKKSILVFWDLGGFSTSLTGKAINDMNCSMEGHDKQQKNIYIIPSKLEHFIHYPLLLINFGSQLTLCLSPPS